MTLSLGQAYVTCLAFGYELLSVRGAVVTVRTKGGHVVCWPVLGFLRLAAALDAMPLL